MGPAMFCLALRPGLKRFREEFEREVEAFAYMDGVSLGLMGITADTVRALTILRRELEDIGIVVNPAKTIKLPPEGYAPKAEEVSLLESVDVHIAGEGGTGDGGGCLDRHGRLRAGPSNRGSEGWSCLLYTSPSPRDKRQSRMPSSA